MAAGAGDGVDVLELFGHGPEVVVPVDEVDVCRRCLPECRRTRGGDQLRGRVVLHDTTELGRGVRLDAVDRAAPLGRPVRERRGQVPPLASDLDHGSGADELTTAENQLTELGE